MASGNQSQSPAPSTEAGQTKEGEGRQGINPLPPYVITPQEIQLLGWLQTAKKGDRMELLNTTPPAEPGAARISGETRFFNFRVKYNNVKKTLIILSGGFTVTVNPLRGARIYGKDKKILKEYNDCWAALLFSLANTLITQYGYNVFSTKWQTVSLPSSDQKVRKLVALVISLINGKEKELRDPLFRACIDGGNSPNSKTP